MTTFADVFNDSDDAPAGNVRRGPWPAVSADPVHTHVAMIHRFAASCDGKLIVASYGYDSESRQGITPKVRHFAIGDVDGMTAAVRDLTGEKFRNVYAPLCVMRADLPDRDKGTEADIVAVLGLVGDFDDAGAADYSSRLPIAPNYVLETSAGRFQTFYLFTRPLPMAEAKALGERLKLHARCDHGTVDMSHVWRAPGTPNWPSEKKLKVGRSPEPQQVRVAQPWDGSLTDPADLDRLLPPLPVAPAVNIITDSAPIDLASLSDDLRRLIVDGPAPEDDRSDKFHYVVTTLTEARHSPEAIHGLLAQHPGGVAEKYKDRLPKEIKRCAAKATRKSPQEEFTKWSPLVEAPAWVAEINEHHATVNEFGKPVVYVFRPTGDRHSKIERIGYEDFAKLTEHDLVQVNGKWVSRNLAWRRAKEHRHYNEVVFEPGETVPAGTLNLWQGWPVDPAPGDWSLMRAHIRDVICDGDDVRYAYALQWLAWKVQHPGGRPEVAFTIHGPKGTGKGRFAHWYGRLFGEHRVTAKHRDEVLGRFNNHLHHCALLVAEEAFFARDPTADGPLKVMITEPDYRVEFKFGANVRVPNKLAIMMLSNHDSVVPATADERRYFVTKVSAARIRDFGYFTALDRQMEAGGLAAMLHDLMTMDLAGFNIRDVPNTAALKEQKRHAAKGVEAWLWNVLEEGRIPGDYGGYDWTDTGLEVVKDRLHKAYRETDKPHPLAESIFAKKLVEIMGDTVTSSRPTVDNIRVRSWKFDPLPKCRATFEAHMNVAGYVWPKC
jgi:hypothetical protein